jgi:hypothetical protein
MFTYGRSVNGVLHSEGSPGIPDWPSRPGNCRLKAGRSLSISFFLLEKKRRIEKERKRKLVEAKLQCTLYIVHC